LKRCSSSINSRCIAKTHGTDNQSSLRKEVKEKSPSKHREKSARNSHFSNSKKLKYREWLGSAYRKVTTFETTDVSQTVRLHLVKADLLRTSRSKTRKIVFLRLKGVKPAQLLCAQTLDYQICFKIRDPQRNKRLTLKRTNL